MRRVVWVLVAAVAILAAGCGRETSAEEQELIARRDAIFADAGVELPDDITHGFSHTERVGRCNDSWFFQSAYLFQAYLDFHDPATEPNPLDTAERFLSAIIADGATEIALYERPLVPDPALVQSRRIAWTTDTSSNFVSLRAGSGYTIRFETQEECKEGTRFALIDRPGGWEQVEQFGQGDQPGCGGTRKPCPDN